MFDLIRTPDVRTTPTPTAGTADSWPAWTDADRWELGPAPARCGVCPERRPAVTDSGLCAACLAAAEAGLAPEAVDEVDGHERAFWAAHSDDQPDDYGRAVEAALGLAWMGPAL